MIRIIPKLAIKYVGKSRLSTYTNSLQLNDRSRKRDKSREITINANNNVYVVW